MTAEEQVHAASCQTKCSILNFSAVHMSPPEHLQAVEQSGMLSAECIHHPCMLLDHILAGSVDLTVTGTR